MTDENSEKEPDDTSWSAREKCTQTEDDFGIEDVDDDEVFRSLYGEDAIEEEEEDEDGIGSVKKALDDAAFMARLSDPDPRGFSGLHKICRVARDGEFDNAWRDVRRYFKLTDEAVQKKAAKKKQFGGLLPLHLACRKKPPRDIIERLLELNPNAVHSKNKAGMLPIHTACLNSAPLYVIQILIQSAGKECLIARDKSQRLPLHCAYKNEGCSPSVVLYLLDVGGIEMLMVPDRNRRMPISRTKMYFATMDHTSRTNVENAKKLLTNYILPCQYWDDHSEDLFVMIRKLHIKLQVVSLVTSRSRKAADMHFVQRPCMILTALDFDFHLLLALGYSLAASEAVYHGESIDQRRYRLLLSIGLCWHVMRNVLRMLVARYPLWIADFWNWVDFLATMLVSYTTYFIFSADYLGNGARNVIAFTAGVLWLLFLKRLRNAFYFISVFLGAMEYVVFSLITFCITMAILLSAFAQVFYLINLESSYCKEIIDPDLDWYCGDSGGLLGKIHAILYTALINGVEVYVVGGGNAATTVLLYMFGFIVGLFFLNVLIAIMTSAIRRAEDYGRRSYVRNRFLFVAETRAIMTDYHPSRILPRILVLCIVACAKCISFLVMSCVRAIYDCIKYFICCCFFPEEDDDDDDDDEAGKEDDDAKQRAEEKNKKLEEEDQDRNKIDVSELFYGPEEWSENRAISGDGFQAFCYRIMVPIGIVLWFIVGLACGGILWPMWMKEALFLHDVKKDKENNDSRDLWDDDEKRGIKDSSVGASPSSPAVADVDLTSVTEQVESLRENFEDRLQTMQKSMDGKVNALESKMNERMEHLQKKMDENNLVLLEILRLLQVASTKRKKRRTPVSIASSGAGQDSLSTLGASLSSFSANT